MLKQKAVLEYEINQRIYQLTCPADSPLGELHDALMQMKGYCVDKMIENQRAEDAAAKQQLEQLGDTEMTMQEPIEEGQDVET